MTGLEQPPTDVVDPNAPQDEPEPVRLPDSGPMSAKAWRSRITASEEFVREQRDKFHWTRNVQRVAGKGGQDTLTPTGVALLPKDYSYSEQKKPMLFYQLPDIMCSPLRGDVDVETCLLIAKILNDLAGPGEVNALPTIKEILTDVLVPSGVGIVKIGLETFVDPNQPTRTVPMTMPGMPGPDGQPGPPIPRLGPLGEPLTQELPNIVRERWFMDRISPLDWLFDVGFKGSDWAKCAWQGHKYRRPAHQLEKKYNLAPGTLGNRDQDGIKPDENQSLSPMRDKQQLSGVECIDIYYRAIEFDETVGDPDLVMQMIFVDGIDEPVYHDVPTCQVVDDNRVVIDGLRRPPIYPLTLHYVSDTPVPPSDCSMSRTLVDELSKGRQQMWEQRDRNVPMRGINLSRVTPEARDAVTSGKYQMLIPFDDVQAGEQLPLFGIAQSAYPQENFNFNNIGERDLQECWALSGSNLGTAEASGRTATELEMRQQGTDNRMGSEQSVVELWWISIVQGFAAMLQIYADFPMVTSYVDQQGAQKVVTWTKSKIRGEFQFSVRPDSSKRVDQVGERKFRLDTMNLLMNVPGINQQEIVKWAAPSLGLDPAKILMQPQKPEPEPPRVSLSIATTSLNPFAPEYAATVAILKSRGIDVLPPPPTDPNAPPPAPGAPGGAPGQPVTAAAGAPPISKHSADQTGMLPGGGRVMAST